MAHFLVTGGCGFIGSHLCDRLLGRGDRVRVLDDLSTGHREYLADGAELVLGDVADSAAVTDAMQGVDGCFHLAAIASVQRCTDDWAASHRVNLGGTVNVFEAARENRQTVVYASSAAVFGDNPHIPLDENAETKPLSAYGADKLGSELHARVGQHVHGIPSTGLRFFNVYGPRQDPASPYSGVIAIFAARLGEGRPVKIFGDGDQSRDFVYVGDVVSALVAAMDDQQRRTAAAADAEAKLFNICTGTATTVTALAETLGEILGIQPDIRHEPERKGDIRHSLGNPTRARNELGFEASTPLATGLRNLLDQSAAR